MRCEAFGQFELGDGNAFGQPLGEVAAASRNIEQAFTAPHRMVYKKRLELRVARIRLALHGGVISGAAFSKYVRVFIEIHGIPNPAAFVQSLGARANPCRCGHFRP
jgi:hypothetical protein